MLFSLLAEAAGFELSYVPFESGGEAATALVGESVDAISTSPQEVAALIDAGEIRLLATPSVERVEEFPDLPTFQEEGYDIVLEQWRGFVYAGGVPAEIVECMNYVLWQASQDPGFQDYMEQNMLIDGYLPGDEFYQLLEQETEENRQFLEDAGLI
jgi:tripartite-type tricarboxylate transporter receptor subunit TctC